MTYEQLVERVARIVCCGGDDKCDRRWHNQGPCDIRAEDRTSMDQARAILSLVADALGEPTEEMLAAFQSQMVREFGITATAGYHKRIHAAMLNASPLKGPKP